MLKILKRAADRVRGVLRRDRGPARSAVSSDTGDPRTPLAERTVEQLRNRASELDIDGRSTMRKAELVEAIRRDQSSTTSTNRSDTGDPRAPLEERTVEQLRSRAAELDIEGRSTMRKAELVEAIQRDQGSTPSTDGSDPGDSRTPLEDWTVEQLRNRASELDIEGRSTMKKAELVKAIRDRNG